MSPDLAAAPSNSPYPVGAVRQPIECSVISRSRNLAGSSYCGVCADFSVLYRIHHDFSNRDALPRVLVQILLILDVPPCQSDLLIDETLARASAASAASLSETLIVWQRLATLTCWC
jgi:hypothetical protein